MKKYTAKEKVQHYENFLDEITRKLKSMQQDYRDGCSAIDDDLETIIDRIWHEKFDMTE